MKPTRPAAKKPAAAGTTAESPTEPTDVPVVLTQERLLRQSQARVLRVLRANWRGSEAMLFVSSLAQVFMHRAVEDCELWDRYLTSIGRAPMFVIKLKPFDTPGCFNAIQSLLFHELRHFENGKKPYIIAWRQGGFSAARSKLCIADFRDSLRDLGSGRLALLHNAELIKQRLEEGDFDYFESLGGILKEHRMSPHKFRRNLSDWLARYWLSFCLWECQADGVEAHSRCLLAAKLMRYPLVRDGTMGFSNFMSAWRNVRQRTFQGSRLLSKPPSP